MSKDPFKKVLATAVNSYAYDVAYDLDNDVTVAQGSQYITGTATFPYHAAGAVLAVGDYIKLGVPGTPPTVASETYRVTELTSTTTTKLDRPVTAISGTYAAATHDAIVTAKADAEGATVKWGIRLSGNDAGAPFSTGLYGANLIMFSVGVSTDFSTTEVRLTTAPFPGVATQNQLTQIEWDLRANTREAYRIAEYPIGLYTNVSSVPTQLRAFNFKEASTMGLDGPVSSYLTLYIGNDGTADASLDTVFTQ